jgi:hypothetical protein
VPDHPGAMPRPDSGRPSLIPLSAIRMSPTAASSRPPPKARFSASVVRRLRAGDALALRGHLIDKTERHALLGREHGARERHAARTFLHACALKPSDVAWLARAHAISVLPAVSSLRALRRIAGPTQAAKPFLGIGDPALNDSPGCNQEILDQAESLFQRAPV